MESEFVLKDFDTNLLVDQHKSDGPTFNHVSPSVEWRTQRVEAKSQLCTKSHLADYMRFSQGFALLGK